MEFWSWEGVSFFFFFLLVFYDLICWRVRNFVKTLKVKGCLLI